MMKTRALHGWKTAVMLLVTALALMISCAALAGTLTLPAGLTEIEAEAFMNDASLEDVVIPEGVVSIGQRAFSGTGLSHLTLPASLERIDENAFSGCDTMSVSAPEGSWAYEWALKNGYLKTGANTPTRIILPQTLQAGEDLTVSIIGASNTVLHGVYLIQESDQTRVYRSITKCSGKITWEGYQLEPGTYRVTVYTVTDAFTSLSPVSQQVTVIGSKPVAEPIEFPDHASAAENIYLTDINDNSCFADILVFDADGKEIDSYSAHSYDDRLMIWTDYEELLSGGSIKVAYSLKVNGLWSQPITATITILPCEQLGTPEIVFPDQILAGHDLELYCEWVENATYYNYSLYSNEVELYYGWQRFNDRPDSEYYFIPGYLLSAGDYELEVYTYNENGSDSYQRESWKSYPFTVTGELPEAPSVSLKQDSIRIKHSSAFVINTQGADRIKVLWQYQGYGQSKDTIYTVNDETEWTITPPEEYANIELTLQFSVHKDNRWSALTTLTYIVEDVEQLAKPVIHIDSEYPAGKNVTFYFDAVEQASEYDCILYREDQGIAWSWDSNDLYFDVDGYLLTPGNYRFVVKAYGDNYHSNTAAATFRVTGTQPSAPVLTSNQELVYEDEPVTITIISDNAEKARVKIEYNNADGSYFTHDICNYDLSTTGTDRISCDIWVASGKTIRISACTTVDDTWSSWSNSLTWTVLSREQLVSPAITVNEAFNAGEDIPVQFSAVEHAESYYVEVRRVYGNERVYNATIDAADELSVTVPGYLLKLASYRVIVTASATEYKTSSAAMKTFQVSGEWPEAPEVTLQQDAVRINSNAIFVIDTEEADLVRISYKATIPDGGYYSNTQNITVESTQTEWSYTPYKSTRNGTFTLQVTVYKNNLWSAWKTLNYTIEDLEQLAQPTLQINETYQAGETIALRFDAVANAESYYWSIYDTNTNTSLFSGNKTISSVSSILGCDIGPGTYCYSVTAYANGYNPNTAEKNFIVKGIKESMNTVAVDKTTIHPDETFTFTIDTAGLSALRYRVNQNNSNYSINVLNDTTRFTTSNVNKGEHSYQFAGLRNGRWTAWSKPIIITVEQLQELDSILVTINDTIHQGENLTITYSEVAFSAHYIVLYDENGIELQDYYFYNSATPVSIEGCFLTPGNYSVRVKAYTGSKWIYSSYQTFTVLPATLSTAPEILNTTSEIVAGSAVSFTVSTLGAEKLAVRFYQDGYTNNLYTDAFTVTGTETLWRKWLDTDTGQPWFCQFAVYRDGAWSDWTAWQEVQIIADQPSD